MVDELVKQFQCKNALCEQEREHRRYDIKEQNKQIIELKSEIAALKEEVEYLTQICNNCQKCQWKI